MRNKKELSLKQQAIIDLAIKNNSKKEDKMNKITLIGHLIKGLPGDPRTSGNRYEVVLVLKEKTI